MYASVGERPAMISEGKISFRTCTQEARIPTSYLIKLASREYSMSDEPGNLSQSIHHWMLTECLSAIGAHSML